MMRGKLYEIAVQTRHEFEEGDIDRDLLTGLYMKYKPDIWQGAAEQFVNIAFEIFPRGCCGLSAVYLRHIMQQGEVRAACEYDGEPHTLFLPFKRIGNIAMDITGDQFGGPSVYVGPIQDPIKIV